MIPRVEDESKVKPAANLMNLKSTYIIAGRSAMPKRRDAGP